MKYSYAIAIATLILATGCNSTSDKHIEHDNHEHHNDSSVQHNHADDSPASGDEIVLEPADAERFGVSTRIVKHQPFKDVISVSGQILGTPSDQAVITAYTSGILKMSPDLAEGTQVRAGQSIGSISATSVSGGDTNAAARIAVEAAKKELDRLTPLLADGIVTKREYNAALAAYESAKASYSPTAASGRVTAPISGVIAQIMTKSGEYVDAGTPIALIGKNTHLTLRANLPEKYRNLLSTITSGNFRTGYSDEWLPIESFNGRRIDATKEMMPAQSGYIPVYFTLDNDGTLSSGTFVEIRLIGGNRGDALVVPTDAISEQQGNYFVYVKISGHGYLKKAVTIGLCNGPDTEVLSGISDGDEVVVKGTSIVKLAESNGVVPEGHSHNH